MLLEASVHPFTQGTIDTFCAAYAVMNALQITHGIKPLDGRNLFSNLLLSISKDPMVFTRVLNLKTNYVAMVDFFIDIAKKQYPIKVTKPFAKNESVTATTFWDVLEAELDPDNKKTAVFQFEKRIATLKEPMFAHWTTPWEVVDDEIILFDCSPERNAIKKLHKKKTYFEPLPYNSEYVFGEYMVVNAYTLCLIEAM